MNRKLIGLLVLIFTVVISASQVPAADKNIVGEWMGKHGDENISFLFNADKSLVVAVGGAELKGTYEVDYTATPVNLDITLDFGGQKKTSLTIVEFLDANKIRMEEPGDDRPSDFKKDPVTFMRKVAAGGMDATKDQPMTKEAPKEEMAPKKEESESGGQEFKAVPFSIDDVWKK